MFCEGGHGGKTLRKIINDFEKKTRTTINTTNDNNTNKKQTVTVPWVPKLGKGVRGEIQKFVFGVAFKTSTDLDSTLCKNRDKLVPGSYPRLYKLGCSCGSVYSGGARRGRELLLDQWGTNGKVSGVAGHPLELLNTRGNAMAVLTGCAPKLSP